MPSCAHIETWSAVSRKRAPGAVDGAVTHRFASLAPLPNADALLMLSTSARFSLPYSSLLYSHQVSTLLRRSTSYSLASNSASCDCAFANSVPRVVTSLSRYWSLMSLAIAGL